MRYYIFKDGIERKVTIGKIICLARSYRKHAEEMNQTITKDPLLFLKPASSVIFNGESIIIPSISTATIRSALVGPFQILNIQSTQARIII